MSIGKAYCLAIKHLLRTPMKTVLFFLLMAAATALLVLGANLWAQTQAKIDAAEGLFVTLGTVEQLPDYEAPVKTKTLDSLWLGAEETEPVYGTVYDESVLDFPGAAYVHGPEKRTYYAALLPEEYTAPERQDTPPFNGSRCVIEFTPLESGRADRRQTVQVNRVLYGTYSGDEMKLCDMLSENAMNLDAGKRYLAYVTLSAESLQSFRAGDTFFVPQSITGTPQVDAEGNRLNDGVTLPTIMEVTPQFYDSETWEIIQSWAQALYTRWQSYPVLAAESLDLLPSFHENTVFLSAGRAITDAEFADGAAVCMVSAEFARNAGLAVGDRVPLSLYLANKAESPQWEFGFQVQWRGGRSPGLLNAAGEPYSVFFEQTYEIVGLYDTFRLAGSKNGTGEIARNMFIVPTASMTASDAENIGAFGAMNRYTTSFQIPNGTVDDYIAAYNRNVPAEVRENLEITFDDNGYSQIIGGLLNMRYVAIILFAAGLLSALAILVLLLYFFIVKQKKRTAIERSFGMSKNQCRVSLASGVVVLSAAAVILGTVCSSMLFDKVQTLDLTGQSEHTFSTEYSLWARDENAVETEDAENTGVLELVIPAAMILLTAGLSVILVNRSLKYELIEMLNK